MILNDPFLIVMKFLFIFLCVSFLLFIKIYRTCVLVSIEKLCFTFFWMKFEIYSLSFFWERQKHILCLVFYIICCRLLINFYFILIQIQRKLNLLETRRIMEMYWWIFHSFYFLSPNNHFLFIQSLRIFLRFYVWINFLVDNDEN